MVFYVRIGVSIEDVSKGGGTRYRNTSSLRRGAAASGTDKVDIKLYFEADLMIQQQPVSVAQWHWRSSKAREECERRVVNETLSIHPCLHIFN